MALNSTSSNITGSNGTSGASLTSDDIVFYTFNIGLICLISCVNIVGNSLVIQSVLRHRQLNVPGNYFIVSLACSDLLMGVIYPFYNVSHMVKMDGVIDTFGTWEVCSTLTILTFGALYWSSYNLVGITVTRYVCIQSPLTAQSKLTPWRTLVAAITVACSCWGINLLLHLRVTPTETYSSVCRYELVYEEKMEYIIFNAIFACVIPVLIMGVLYGHMAIIAKSKIETMEMLRVGATEGTARRIWLLKKEMRLFGVAGILIGYFALAWTPYITFEFLSVVLQMDIDRYVRATVRILLHSNTAVNVLIYAGRLHEFKSAIQHDVYKCFHFCSKDVNLPSTALQNEP